VGFPSYFVALELLSMVQSGAGHEIQPVLMYVSTMTWQRQREVRGMQRGAEEQAGENGVVWDVPWMFVVDGGAGRVIPLSTRCVLTNVSPHSHVTLFDGL
jgi:hypothetical protein